jgi:peptide chain release factor 2
LNKKIEAPGFWGNQESAQSVMKKRGLFLNKIEKWEQLDKKRQDVLAFRDLITETGDQTSINDFKHELKDLESSFNTMELEALFREEHDHLNAILTIHSGAGGTESQDWAQMLFRMYTRWGERKGFDVKILDFAYGEEAGIKTGTINISGTNVYGLLRAETGVHRLVRISPFDANKRRHTSFASVFVYPEIDDSINIDVNETDLKIDTYRAGGKGGQHVNVTDSAVRITHIPTGIVVQCQNERSQHRNKDAAMKVLLARIYDYELQQKLAEKDKMEKSKKKIAWGSQIRSYILHPYRLIKDHRLDLDVGNADAVLDGDIDVFIENYLKSDLNK